MQLAANTIRISFSYENTLEEVDTLIANLEDILKEIKQ
jgi:cysteine sulfinate desulfinase/cysteine desulfurase-like protein